MLSHGQKTTCDEFLKGGLIPDASLHHYDLQNTSNQSTLQYRKYTSLLATISISQSVEEFLADPTNSPSSAAPPPQTPQTGTSEAQQPGEKDTLAMLKEQ